MRKEDLSVPALFLEALTFLLGIFYMALQIFYGIRFHIGPVRFMGKVLAMVLVYAALLVLEYYPERVNRLSDELFTALVRTLTLRMLRMVKFVFVGGLFVPSLCDALGIALPSTASLVVIIGIAGITFYYEYRIYQECKMNRR